MDWTCCLFLCRMNKWLWTDWNFCQRSHCRPVLPDSLISKGVAYELNNFRSMTTHGIVYMTGWRSSVMFHHYHYQASNLHCQGWTKSDLNFLVTNIMNKSKCSLRSLFSPREKLSISSNLQIALLNKVMSTKPDFTSKNKRKLSVDEVCSNFCELLLPATNMSSDPEGLIGRRIRHRWNVEGSEHWYVFRNNFRYCSMHRWLVVWWWGAGSFIKFKSRYW